MVKIVAGEGKTFYLCEECGLRYNSRDMAMKCEEFCRKYHQCSLRIIKHAIK